MNFKEVTPAEWVAALESDDWTPVPGQLLAVSDTPAGVPHVQGHCCLGVLGRLVGYTDSQLEYALDTSVPYRDTEGFPDWLKVGHAEAFAAANDRYGRYPIDLIKETYNLD